MKSPGHFKDILSFNSISLEDKAMFEQFIASTPWPVNLWSCNFAFLWSYSNPRKQLLWTIVDDMLVTFSLSNGKKLSVFCLPFGTGDADKLAEVLYKCLLYCVKWNAGEGSPAKVRLVNINQLDYLQSSDKFNRLFITRLARGIERHYGIYDLLLLQGKKFDSLRKVVNKYYRQYPQVRIRTYRPRDYQNLLNFNISWEKTAGKKYPVIIDRGYFKKIVKYYRKLGLMILVAELDREIVGVNIGGELPTGEAWGCICKTAKDIIGLNEAIILRLVQELNRKNKKIQYLNVGSDMGIRGLIRFKDKFKPVLNLKRYKVFLKRPSQYKP